MGDGFNVVITTIQSLNRTQMSRTKNLFTSVDVCGVRVCGVACTWHGWQFFKVPKCLSFNEKQDK